MSLQEYLEEITGEKVLLIPFNGQKKLPLFLCGYQFQSGDILAQRYIFAHDQQCRFTPLQYFSQWSKLQELLHAKVILVFDVLPSVKRNRLFQAGVPFIVPGCQFFLPPGIHFKERGKRQIRPDNFLPFPAQLLIIRELLFHDVSGIMQRELALKTGYSQMSISLAADALTEKGLCTLIPEKKTRLIDFNFKDRELWNRSLPLMRSPVRKTCWNLQQTNQFPLAGISALSQRSMLAPDTIPTFAADMQSVKALPDFQQADSKESAQSILEIWQYTPIVCEDGCVDPFSLYLSLKDDGDPRIDGCLNEMMENIKWYGD